MHEMSLAEGILQIIEDQAAAQGFSKVKTVCLEIGQLSHVEPEALRFCFDAVMRDTQAEEATLKIVLLDGEGWCVDCEKTVAYQNRYDPCPHCSGFKVQVTRGEEMRVKELEVV